MSCISLGTFARPTGNFTALSQTSSFGNYHPLTLALLMRHTRTSKILSLQQQNCQFHAVAEATIGHVGERSANISTRFFYGLHKFSSNFSKSLCAIFWCCAKYYKQKLILCTVRTRMYMIQENLGMIKIKLTFYNCGTFFSCVRAHTRTAYRKHCALQGKATNSAAFALLSYLNKKRKKLVLI